MKQRIKIHAVELVRGIRDAQAAKLAGKSDADVIEFFNRAAERAEERIAKMRALARTTRHSGGAPQPSKRKARRGA